MTTIFENPLIEPNATTKVPDPCVVIIFGATGDLTARKLVPALYDMSLDRQLPGQLVCTGFARRPKDHKIFRDEMLEAVNKYSRVAPIDQKAWESFSERLFYHRSEFDNDEGYERLKTFLKEIDNQFGTKGNRLFYLSTQPSFFPLIVGKLKKHGLIYDSKKEKKRWSRVIVEKPFGHDLSSAKELQKEMCRHLNESQIYRIDHYLGKETVQNLLIFRFANSLFESLWNSDHIDHVQITVAESIGVGTRGNFFEEAGILRDIVQNHLIQLLALTAMEPPKNLDADSIRSEKVNVLQAIRPIAFNDVVAAQYAAGVVDGDAAQAYREENNVPEDSVVETYAAMKLHIDNARWSGVPFYIRAGKRLPKRATEIAVQFKKAACNLFPNSDHNVLVIRIQPNEGISLKINCKVPGLTSPIQPVKMDFRYGSYFGAKPPEAYERLICDCMNGDTTLFARDDEVMTSWELFTPILEHWKNNPLKTFYPSGSWGPNEADALTGRDGRQWRLV